MQNINNFEPFKAFSSSHMCRAKKWEHIFSSFIAHASDELTKGAQTDFLAVA
jgi:hypothetical protein